MSSSTEINIFQKKSDKISFILKIVDYKHKIYLIYLKKIFLIIFRICFFFGLITLPYNY